MSKTQSQNFHRADSALPTIGAKDQSPKESVGSVGSTLSFETRDVDNDKNSKFSMRGLEFGSNDSSNGQDIENFKQLDLNPIFRQLCRKDKFDDKGNCKVCGKSFKLLNKKKNCKFCGGRVCEEHSKKKRPNPENTTEYVRVCDVCDEQYVQRIILSEFKVKLDKKQEVLDKLESEAREQQNKIRDVQKDVDELNLKKSRNDKNYSDQMNFLTTDIAKAKEESKKCDKENAELTKELARTQKRIEDLDVEIQQSEKEYEKLSKEAADLTVQIETLNQDIAQMNKNIRTIEETIAQNNNNKAATNNAPVVSPTNTTPVLAPTNTDPVVAPLEPIDTSPVLAPVNTSPVLEPVVITTIEEPQPPPVFAPVDRSMSEIRDQSSIISSASNDKRSSMVMKAPRMARNAAKNKSEDGQKSAPCNVGCNLF